MKKRIDTTSISERFNMLPNNMKEEVLDFIDFLLYKNAKQPKGKVRQFGIMEGKIKLAANFDEPLSDFEEYM